MVGFRFSLFFALLVACVDKRFVVWFDVLILPAFTVLFSPGFEEALFYYEVSTMVYSALSFFPLSFFNIRK